MAKYSVVILKPSIMASMAVPTGVVQRRCLHPNIVDEADTWTRKHLSALEIFNKIIRAWKGNKIAMFLDYDGTLSPIVDDLDKMCAAIKCVASYLLTAIVSGRCRGDHDRICLRLDGGDNLWLSSAFGFR